jgi:hypothetical protein
MTSFIAIDHQIVIALDDAEFGARDAREWLEGRTRRPPAVRAVTIRGINEFVRHRVLDRAAQALSPKRAVACLVPVCHRLLRFGFRFRVIYEFSA